MKEKKTRLKEAEELRHDLSSISGPLHVCYYCYYCYNIAVMIEIR